jgi:hypothetical protein
MLKIIISAFAIIIIIINIHMLFAYSEEQKSLKIIKKSIESDISVVEPIIMKYDKVPRSWSTYENIKYGIKIKHPYSWDVDTKNRIDRNGCQIDIVTLYHPVKQVELNIFITLYDRETSPDSLFDELEFREIDYSFFDIISSSATSHMGTYPAYEITYDQTIKNKILRTLELGTINGNNVYNIDFRGYTKDFKSFKIDAEMMISTFKIVHPPIIKATSLPMDESSSYMNFLGPKLTHVDLPYMHDTDHKLMHVNCFGPSAPR